MLLFVLQVLILAVLRKIDLLPREIIITEMLKEEVSRAEAKEHEALAAASAAKAYSLTVGENEVRLRMMLEEQGAQLATASREEASVREALDEYQRAEVLDGANSVDCARCACAAPLLR